jgi:hypothetical protein
MLRIRLRRCQDIVPDDGLSKFLANPIESPHHGPCGTGKDINGGIKTSPINLSTTVLLTGTVPKLILLVFGHCPTCQGGERLSKRREGAVCIDSEQAHRLSCLTLMC